MSSRWTKWAAVAVLAVMFGYMRTADIMTRPLWLDEAGQAWISGAPTVAEMHQRALAWDRHPPGFSWLLRPIALASPGEAALRAVSLAAGMLAVGCAWFMARAWLPTWEAGCAVLLVGASASLALYSREARPYSVGVLALLVSFWMLGRHWNDPTWKSATALAVASLVAGLFLYASSVVLGATLLGALVCDRVMKDKMRGRAPGLCVSLIALALAGAWLWTCYLRHHEAARTTAAMYLTDLPDHGSAVASGAFLTKGSVGLFSYLALGHVFGPRWHPAAVAIGSAMLVLALTGVVSLWRRGGATRVLSVSVLATVITFMALALLRLHPYGGTRHCLVLAPVAVVAVAAGLGALRTRAPILAGGALLLLMLAGFSSSLRSTTPSYMVEDLPTVLRGIHERREPGDRLVVAEPAALAFKYYWSLAGLNDVTILKQAPGQVAIELGTRSPSEGSREWVVFSHCTPEEIEVMENFFAKSAERVDELKANGASASCWKTRTR